MYYFGNFVVYLSVLYGMPEFYCKSCLKTLKRRPFNVVNVREFINRECNFNETGLILSRKVRIEEPSAK